MPWGLKRDRVKKSSRGTPPAVRRIGLFGGTFDPKALFFQVHAGQVHDVVFVIHDQDGLVGHVRRAGAGCGPASAISPSVRGSSGISLGSYML